jgi:7-carboxy-7-deazaguanine synthase
MVRRSRLADLEPETTVVSDGDRLVRAGRVLQCCGGATACVLKIVVFDNADYDFARTVSARYPALSVYLQVGNPAPLTAPGWPMAEEADLDDLLARLRWLVGKVVMDRWFAATVLPQLHVLAWGNKRGT